VLFLICLEVLTLVETEEVIEKGTAHSLFEIFLIVGFFLKIGIMEEVEFITLRRLLEIDLFIEILVE